MKKKVVGVMSWVFLVFGITSLYLCAWNPEHWLQWLGTAAISLFVTEGLNTSHRKMP